MATSACTSIETGIYGSVYCGGQRVARVTQWSVEATADEKTWADSGGSNAAGAQGYKNRAPGNRSLTGSVECNYDSVFQQDRRFREGECCQLVLVYNDNNPQAWIIPEALITRFSAVVNIEDGEITKITFDFSSNGRYYAPGEAGAPNVFPLPNDPD